MIHVTAANRTGGRHEEDRLGRLTAVTEGAYAYPLLIKQLLRNALVQARDQKIAYRDLRRLPMPSSGAGSASSPAPCGTARTSCPAASSAFAGAADRWQPVPVVQELEAAKRDGLWNLFLAHSRRGAGLTNLEYAPLAEIMGRVHWSSEVFNCSVPGTGNMETLDLHGTEPQKARWLAPLLEGDIRSAFMTESDVAPLRCDQRREAD